MIIVCYDIEYKIRQNALGNWIVSNSDNYSKYCFKTLKSAINSITKGY